MIVKRRRTFNRPIRTSPPEKRTYRDVVYASIAEMKRAQTLDVLVKSGGIFKWFRQVPFQLGPDTSWKSDFVVINCLYRRNAGDVAMSLWVEDVKEFETPASRRIVRLWKKYGPYTLHIIGLRSGNIEIPAARSAEGGL